MKNQVRRGRQEITLAVMRLLKERRIQRYIMHSAGIDWEKAMPLLVRLTKTGCVEAETLGSNRIVAYKLTQKGLTALERIEKAWDELTAALEVAEGAPPE